MQLSITSKLPNTGTTIFTTMSVLAMQHDAVNLGQGFPDFPMSEALVSLVHEAMRTGHNQYTHMNGLPALRNALAEKCNSLYGCNVNPETEITVTPGATYAIYTALTALLQPGDEVIVFEPAYDSYIPNIKINGAIPVLINLEFPAYQINWDEVRKKITPKTKLIMVNSPHNPTGAVLNEEDMRQLEAIVNDTGIFILSDEVYEHLIFDGIAHQSVLRYPALAARSFVVYSFGKTCNCTGWKLGYCIAPAAFTKEFRTVHQFNCFSCNTPMQTAIAQHIQNKDTYLQLGSYMQQKRDYFYKLMEQTPFTMLPSYGSYFALASYASFSNEPDMDFAARITREYGVATIPVSPFYLNGKDDKVIRFCFAKKEHTLEEAVKRLSGISKK
jgi:methionine transaminase